MPSLRLSRDMTFHPSLSCDGILLISSEVKLRGAKPLIGVASRAYFFQALWLVLRADDSPLRFDEEG